MGKVSSESQSVYLIFTQVYLQHRCYWKLSVGFKRNIAQRLINPELFAKKDYHRVGFDRLKSKNNLTSAQ